MLEKNIPYKSIIMRCDSINGEAYSEVSELQKQQSTYSRQRLKSFSRLMHFSDNKGEKEDGRD